MPIIDDIIALLDFFLNLIIHGWKYILWLILFTAVGILVCSLLP